MSPSYFISAILWLTAVLEIREDSGNFSDIILMVVVVTAFPIGAGIYCIMLWREVSPTAVIESLAVYILIPFLVPIFGFGWLLNKYKIPIIVLVYLGYLGIAWLLDEFLGPSFIGVIIFNVFSVLT